MPHEETGCPAEGSVLGTL